MGQADQLEAQLADSEELSQVNLEAIREAAGRIAPYAHRTPVMTCKTLDDMAGRHLFFKCENLQKGGAFKIRGAANSVFSLSDEEAARGVVTHSSGNHAGAVALAAQLRGIPAHIVVPEGTPQCKLDAIATYNGRITLCEPSMDAREAACAAIQAETGAQFIHPYNYPPTICGQGTIALELLEQVPDLDAIVVPVSGGGLLSGISVAAKALKPGITIVVAEPVGRNDAADVAESLAAGQAIWREKVETIADGLQGRLGSLTWPLIRDHVDGCITVEEAQIVEAMQLMFERMKVVVEPSGAVPLAALLTPQLRSGAKWPDLKRIGVVVSGGNVDLAAKGVWNIWL